MAVTDTGNGDLSAMGLKNIFSSHEIPGFFDCNKGRRPADDNAAYPMQRRQGLPRCNEQTNASLVSTPSPAQNQSSKSAPVSSRESMVLPTFKIKNCLGIVLAVLYWCLGGAILTLCRKPVVKALGVELHVALD